MKEVEARRGISFDCLCFIAFDGEVPSSPALQWLFLPRAGEMKVFSCACGLLVSVFVQGALFSSQSAAKRTFP